MTDTTPNRGRIIDGKAFAAGLRARLATEIGAHVAAGHRAPGLAVVLVGENPASQVYVRNKARQTVECGMLSFEHRLPAETSQGDLLALVRQLNNDPAVDGILVQLPLPDHLDASEVLLTIDPAKDVDGFHPVNAGRLASGLPGLVPCTPSGCLMLIKDVLGDNLSGLNAVVIGRSNIVGKPMAQLLLAENCTVTIAHSRSKHLPEIAATADILVVAVGRPEMVRDEWVKEGAVVIDVGMNRLVQPDGKEKLVGDVAYAEVKPYAQAITPVPGGVGPMTIACLLNNTWIAYRRRSGLGSAA